MQQGAGSSMLKMMTGVDTKSIDNKIVMVDNQTLNSRSSRGKVKDKTLKDEENKHVGTVKDRAASVWKSDKDKMTINMVVEVLQYHYLILYLRVIRSRQWQYWNLKIKRQHFRCKLKKFGKRQSIPIIIGRYSILSKQLNDVKIIYQELGQGTFGQVFACLDQKTGKKFALKFIGYEAETDQDPEFKAAVREIVIMQNLSKSKCVSILQIHDVYPCIKDDNKFLVIVMELCDCNLMELIKVRIEENKSKWTDEELLFILAQLCEGFAIMKKKSVTHRDIKPQNILYSTADKCYKIADLGGAKFLKPAKAEKQQRRFSVAFGNQTLPDDMINTVRGSPAYWAPEIYYFCDLQKDKEGRFFVGKQHLPYDPYQSDVYSLGITFLLMKRLQPRVDREQIKIEVENIRRLKNQSVFEQFLLRMLEQDDSKRIGFEELWQMLQKEMKSCKQPNEDVYVNCLKTGKDKKNMSPMDLMQREINLADAYEKLYLVQHAKTHYELALKYASKLSKENHKADILISLGTVNCDMNNLDEAERYYQESATIYKKLHGDKHTSVADALNNMGIIKRKKGEFEKAIKFYEQAYAIKEVVFGENNLGGALILSNIGLAYRKLGNLDQVMRYIFFTYLQAIKYYKNALQIKKLICGDRSLILCGTYDNLARQ